jgi:hypothetical protein
MENARTSLNDAPNTPQLEGRSASKKARRDSPGGSSIEAGPSNDTNVDGQDLELEVERVRELAKMNGTSSLGVTESMTLLREDVKEVLRTSKGLEDITASCYQIAEVQETVNRQQPE